MVCVATECTTPFTISSSKRAREGQEPRQQHLSVTPEKIEEFGRSRIKMKRETIEKRFRGGKKVKYYHKPIEGSVVMPRLSLGGSKKGRSDSLLTLPSDSEHDDDIYIDDQTLVDVSTEDLHFTDEADTALNMPKDKEKKKPHGDYEAVNAHGNASGNIDDFELLLSAKGKIHPPSPPCLGQVGTINSGSQYL